MERLQKFMTVAFKHGWIKAHPFALYELRFEEFDCPYLEQFELDAMATIHLPNKSMCLVRDVFVFSCYTGLCYIEVSTVRKIKSKSRYRIPVETLNKICEARNLKLSEFFQMVGV
ncbi:hypothetical protein ZORO111902_02440 [Zobellia roscoffensis]